MAIISTAMIRKAGNGKGETGNGTAGNGKREVAGIGTRELIWRAPDGIRGAKEIGEPGARRVLARRPKSPFSVPSSL
jgi:hypothetical protein